MYVEDKTLRERRARDATGPAGAGAGVFVEPDRLDQQAGQFAKLSDELREQAGRADVQPLMLGTAPPAVWFAARFAELAGRGGVSGALLNWADGLAGVSDGELASAKHYRDTDDGNAVKFRRVDG